MLIEQIEPLFQILAAVGLLLSGVLGLVGKLVSFELEHLDVSMFFLAQCC
jgi:hypothetical protein